jgi:YVTN family beta-propeller protein
MRRRLSGTVLIVAALAGNAATVDAQVDPATFVNFEGAQTSPVRLSADGSRLYAVNTPDARLSVFDVSQPSSPQRIAEIPVGIEPVSVNPRTNDEVWVVNQVSDSISVVSVSRRIVIDTIRVKDEPADVVFAGEFAFVTVARQNQVRVFTVSDRRHVRTLFLAGHNPRAMAVTPDGSKVYAAFALSGNRTTIIPFGLAPPQPPPTNPDLPTPVQVGLIVDGEDPAWEILTRYIIPDFDVVEIDARALRVNRYIPRLGTVNLGLAVRPTTGEIYLANTDARNRVRFEPNVRGHFVDNRITRVAPSGPPVFYDLNPGIDYAVMPNPAAAAAALAQPTSIVFEPAGDVLYVAAFGSDRIGVLDADGQVLARIEIGPTAGAAADPARKRGPRGLALHAAAARLYVLNRISNTLSVVDTTARQAIAEIPIGSFDPTPAAIRAGRGFLYDARLSGNGTGSCAACHVDADMDFLAWDLGDPGGQMQTVVQNGNEYPMHPMKGPMTTQTLRGLAGMEPFHWRGDRADFAAFNGAFDSLMGGSPLSDPDMAAFTAFINTIRFQPNPNQNLDRTLPASFLGGNPTAGLNTFMNEIYRFPFTCNTCHRISPGPGTANGIQFVQGQIQPFKVPHLRNVYQKIGMNNRWGGISVNGFGLLNEGSAPNVYELVSQSQFHNFANDTARKLNLTAFVMCFDTGTAPAVGYDTTLEQANILTDLARGEIALLQGQAAAGNIDLIGKGTIDRVVRGLLYVPALNVYFTDTPGVGPFTASELGLKIAQGDVVTLMGVPPGSGVRMGVDRNLDGVLDGAAGAALSARRAHEPHALAADASSIEPALQALAVPHAQRIAPAVLSPQSPRKRRLRLAGTRAARGRRGDRA